MDHLTLDKEKILSSLVIASQLSNTTVRPLLKSLLLEIEITCPHYFLISFTIQIQNNKSGMVRPSLIHIWASDFRTQCNESDRLSGVRMLSLAIGPFSETGRRLDFCPTFGGIINRLHQKTNCIFKDLIRGSLKSVNRRLESN